MTDIRPDIQHHSGINLSDVFFALFKRKWTIILCMLLGIIAAVAVYFRFPAAYVSDAKLLVRYVLERSAVDPIDNTTKPNQSKSMATTDSVIDAEVQILTSWDLAMQVADTIGVKRFGASSKEAAAGGILSKLDVTSSRGSDVINVTYKDRDPQLATLVLQELLSRYFVKHLEVHRSAGAFDFVTQQTDQVRARLNQTEDALRVLRDKTGIVSLKDGLDALRDEAKKTNEKLHDAEADLVEQQALATQMGKDKPKQNQWRSKSSSSGKTLDSLKAQVSGTQAKIEAFKARLRDIQQRTKQLSELGPQIEELERRREMDEANYKYFAASLEKARVDEALDPSKMPNISAVQRPSPPRLDTKTRNKVAFGLAGGGIALGIALAFLRGLVLNRTVGRPLQLETHLRIPLMLSIPHSTASRNGYLALPPNGSEAHPGPLTKRPHNSKLAPWEAGHFMRPYCDAIRDRLGLYFELNHLTHKPKLVGIAGFSADAGASTLAAGLAASLSETNDGKVLLVDVNLGPEEVHPFFQGKPAYPLKAALEPQKKIAPAADNLYLATVGRSTTGGPAQIGLKKFFDMMPNLKASDFDYVIFDMPPLDQTSPTWGMAAFMDKLLLIVEAEKNNRDLVKRSYGKLVAERDNVSVVVNKTRSYIPRWLDSGS
jgi:uncharacterized protein involved in exopolysaccharide biosynthesis/Mrp family chromosome partitioning ATPase